MPRIHASGNVSGVEPETPLGALRQLLIDQRADLEADAEVLVEEVVADVKKATRKRKGGASSPATTTSSASSPKSASSGSTSEAEPRPPAPTTESP